MGILEKIFGTHSENELKRIYPIADRIEALEPDMQALSDEELKNKTQEFKTRLAEGEPLDDILLTAEPALLKMSVMMLLQEKVFTPDEFMNELSDEYGLSINASEVEYLLDLH